MFSAIPASVSVRPSPATLKNAGNCWEVKPASTIAGGAGASPAVAMVAAWAEPPRACAAIAATTAAAR